MAERSSTRRALGCACAFLALASFAPQGALAQEAEGDPASVWMGLQAGGSAYFQLVARFRFVGPLHGEIGGGVWPLHSFAINGSGGLLLEVANARLSRGLQLRPYVASGVGAGVGVGHGDMGTRKSGAAFLSGRGGLGLAIRVRDDREPRELVFTVDGGLWHGFIGSTGEPSRTFTWPMLGVGAFMSIR